MCVEFVESGPLYSALRLVPAKAIHGNTENRLQEDQIKLPAKVNLDGSSAWFGRTSGSAGPTSPPLATVFLWVTAWWVLMSDGQCRGLVGRFGLSGGPLLLVLRRTRSSVNSSAYSSCFLLIPDLYFQKYKSSKTTVEVLYGCDRRDRTRL